MGKKKQKKHVIKRAKKDMDIDQLNSGQDVILESYDFVSERIPVNVMIVKKNGEFVPTYALQVSVISKTTEMILEKVRLELIRRVSLGAEDIGDMKKTDLVEDKFNELIGILIDKYFPDSDEETITFLRSYLKINSLGLGALELLMNDENLEELVINQATEPIWVYHKKHGWLKTNVYLKNEDQIRHYASIIGRKVGRQITVLSPLLDAHLGSGDRVNATLSPVSTNGNTITIRKFSKDPWTITKFLKTRTISAEAAALIWTAIQYELSALIAGGTASGKTSALNVFANFFPPNQRILSIEDTREIVLPKFLHWVPLNTTLPNAEGKGEINMGDLLVNSLRMRPDRILVGEVRRKRETETLFEAIHTGHSVYATFHANSAKETVERLTNAPLDVPQIMLPAISLIIVQFRNRRSGKRRTFQIAEILPTGESNVVMQYDIKEDVLVKMNKSRALYDNISLFTGLTDSEINKELDDKVKVLNYLVKKNIDDVDGVGRIVAEYYTNKINLMRYVNTDKDFPLASQLKLEIPLQSQQPETDASNTIRDEDILEEVTPDVTDIKEEGRDKSVENVTSGPSSEDAKKSLVSDIKLSKKKAAPSVSTDIKDKNNISEPKVHENAKSDKTSHKKQGSIFGLFKKKK
ncbi:MAG: type II/IV secretion system ATPase subunit [Candidatus Woesearchaeota archaeon]